MNKGAFGQVAGLICKDIVEVENLNCVALGSTVEEADGEGERY